MARDTHNTPSSLNSKIDALSRTGAAATTTALGLTGCNFDPYATDTATALTSGTVRGTLIPVIEGDTISELFWQVSVAAGTVTTIKVGLYSAIATPARLAVSANTTTAMDAIGICRAPLTSVYRATATGFVYAAIISVASTAGTVGTMAGWTGKATSSTGGWPVALGFTEASQTDLDATITPTLATAPMWWGWR